MMENSLASEGLTPRLCIECGSRPVGGKTRKGLCVACHNRQYRASEASIVGYDPDEYRRTMLTPETRQRLKEREEGV
jgi:hypothetical protein